jgi:LysM repeat protein
VFVDANSPDDAPVETLEAASSVAPDTTRPANRRSRWGAGLTLVGLSVYALSAQLATNEVVVKPGDTLTKIANDYDVSVQSIAAHNGIDDPNVIIAGRLLVIPSATGDVQHEVRPGDSVTSIAAIYGSTAAAITERNKLTDPNLIRIGQVLVVPRPGPVVTTTVAPPTTAPTTTAPAPVTTTVAPAAPSTTMLPPATASAPATTAPPAPVTTTSTTTAAEATTTTAAPTTTVAPTTTTPPGTIPRVTVPSGGVVSTMWVVQAGDTIASIAQRFSLSPRRLASANALNETDALLPGQRIYVPQS